MAEKQFVDGIIFRLPNEKTPDFVKMSGSMKREQLIKWLSGRSEEYVNFDVKVSNKGNLYCEVNTWKPKAKEEKSLDQEIQF